LTTGKAKIAVEGVIIEDPRTNTVTLKSWPPGKKFESLLKRFSKELSDGLIGFTDVSVTETEIKFQVIRERNRDKIYEEFVQNLKEAIKGQISFEIVLADINQKVIVKSVDSMLMDTYNIFCSMNEKMLNEDIAKEKELMEEYLALDLIRKPLAIYIGQNLSVEQALVEIEKKTVVNAEYAKYLINKYKITKLFTLDTDTTEIDNKIKELTQNLQNINEYVLNQYDEFK
jgi:hypothetical protein